MATNVYQFSDSLQTGITVFHQYIYVL